MILSARSITLSILYESLTHSLWYLLFSLRTRCIGINSVRILMLWELSTQSGNAMHAHLRRICARSKLNTTFKIGRRVIGWRNWFCRSLDTLISPRRHVSDIASPLSVIHQFGSIRNATGQYHACRNVDSCSVMCEHGFGPSLVHFSMFKS